MGEREREGDGSDRCDGKDNCTLVTSACVGRILLSLRRQRVRKRDSGRKGKREKERRLRKIF